MTLAHVSAALGLLAGSAALTLVLFRLLALFPVKPVAEKSSRFITMVTVYAGMIGLTLLIAMLGFILFVDNTRAWPVYQTGLFAVVTISALVFVLRKKTARESLLMAVCALLFVWAAPLIARQVSEPVNKYELVRFYDGYISYEKTRAQLVTFTVKYGKKNTLVYSMLEYKPENKRELSEGVISFDETNLFLKIDENPACRVKKSTVNGEKIITIVSVGKEFPRYRLTSMKEVSQ